MMSIKKNYKHGKTDEYNDMLCKAFTADWKWLLWPSVAALFCIQEQQGVSLLL